MNPYPRFFLMIAVSTALMLGLMYLSSYEIDHFYFSQTRFYMALIMGAAMSILMLTFMAHMYKNCWLNIGIYAVSAVVFAGALYLVRSQATIDDVAYMKAMIPHHSIAILTSERAQITDPRVRRLADGIIETQRREIGQMKALIGEMTQR